MRIIKPILTQVNHVSEKDSCNVCQNRREMLNYDLCFNCNERVKDSHLSEIKQAAKYVNERY